MSAAGKKATGSKSAKPAAASSSKKDATAASSSQKPLKYYPAEDDKQPRKARKSIRPTKLRSSLQPGTILILLAGRFRGKRVILLKTLPQGVLLITGPFKANGVPLRRVNARYVIATSQKVDISSVDSKVIDKVSEENYFTKDKPKKEKGEDAFFKQGDKATAKKPASARVEDQKAVDKALLTTIKKTPFLLSYLHSSFSLRSGDKPHEMKF